MPYIDSHDYGNETIVVYHGTDIDAAKRIRKIGFEVSLSGINAGSMLGNGIYVTATLEKSLQYARRKYKKGCILVLLAYPGRCINLKKRDINMQNWNKLGFDSAFSGDNINGRREEYCIADPKRVRVLQIEYVDTLAVSAIRPKSDVSVCYVGLSCELGKMLQDIGFIQYGQRFGYSNLKVVSNMSDALYESLSYVNKDIQQACILVLNVYLGKDKLKESNIINLENIQLLRVIYPSTRHVWTRGYGFTSELKILKI